MTKEELAQLQYLNLEIEREKERLAELEAMATNTTAHLSGLPHATGITDRVGQYGAEIADLKKMIESNIQQCYRELNKLNQYIQNVHDSEMRQILTLRYINGLSWQQIAFRIGYQDESVPRKRHNRFLKNDRTVRRSA